MENSILFLDEGNIKLNCFVDALEGFVENFDLVNSELWHKFVNVYITKEDTIDGGWRGEFWGKMMRGASISYRYSKNPELYRTLEKTVLDLLKVQDELGRISSYNVECEFQGWDMWCRKYVATGLMHFIDICEDDSIKEKIINSLRKHFDYIIDKIGEGEGKKSILETSKFWGAVNSCSILEPVLDFYIRTNDAKYLEFAEYIISTGGCKNGNLIKSVLQDKLKPSEYPATKAYEVISFFEGLLLYYKITGIKNYLSVVERFVQAIHKHEITVIGCAGYLGEEFSDAVDGQTKVAEWPTQETCVTVTWVRLLSKLYLLTGSKEYFNWFETSVLNAYYGSININKLESKSVYNDGLDINRGVFPFDSYSPLVNCKRCEGVGGLKDLGLGGYYGCCACIGSVVTGLAPFMAYTKTSDAYIINQYFSGNITFSEDVSISVSGGYPVDNDIKIIIRNKKANKIKILFRIPEWADSYFINGRSDYEIKNGYVELDGAFADENEVRIIFNCSVKSVERGDSFCFTYGPLVLACDEKLNNLKERCGKVRFDICDKLEINRVESQNDELVRFELRSDNESLILTDYASCGKKWVDDNSRVSVWLTNKNI